MKTSGGGFTNNAADATVYVWQVTIPRYRDTATKSHTFSTPVYTDPKGTFTQSTIQ